MKMLQSQKTEYDGEFWKQTNKTSPPSPLHPLSTAIKSTKQIYKKTQSLPPFFSCGKMDKTNASKNNFQTPKNYFN